MHLKLSTTFWEKLKQQAIPTSLIQPVHCFVNICSWWQAKNQDKYNHWDSQTRPQNPKHHSAQTKKQKRGKGGGKSHHQVDRIYLDSIHVLHLFLKRSITDAQYCKISVIWSRWIKLTLNSIGYSEKLFSGDREYWCVQQHKFISLQKA